MSAPHPPSGSGTVAIEPSAVQDFAGRVDALEQGVSEAHEALRRLADEPLATGTGQDNAAISAWYRELVSSDSAPAARDLAGELDGVRTAVREGATSWEHTESGTAGSFRPVAGTE